MSDKSLLAKKYEVKIKLNDGKEVISYPIVLAIQQPRFDLIINSDSDRASIEASNNSTDRSSLDDRSGQRNSTTPDGGDSAERDA